MFGRARAVISANAALRAYERGNLDTARGKIRHAERYFAAEPDSSSRNRDLGRLHQLAGQVELQAGRIEDGLRSFARAEEYLERDSANRRHYGEAMHDIAIYLGDLGMFPLARLYIDKAAQAVGHLPEYADQMRRMQEEFAAHGADQPISPEMIERLRSGLMAARSNADRAMHAFNLGAALLETDTPDRSEAFDLIQQAVDYLRPRDQEKFLQCLSVLGDSRQRGQRFPEWLGQASEVGLRTAQRLGRPQLIAETHLYRAAYLLSVDDLDGARQHALLAIARNSEISLRTESSAMRLFNNMGGEAAREVALIVACRTNDADLAAELLESARLQVLPIGSSKSDQYAGMSGTGILTTFGTSKVSQLRPVAVDGRSRLAALYAPDVAGPPLEFREFLRRVGGEEAWWWGAWAFNDRIYWCVRGGSVAECGYLDASDGTELGDAIQTLLAASLVNDDATLAVVLNGPLCASYREEEALSAILGCHLIPPALRTELRRRASVKDPLHLVLSGTLFAILPVALLGIEPASVDRYPTRLVEASVLRVAAPAALVDHVDRHPTYFVDELSVSVACLDPTGDLEYSRAVPRGTEIVLTGAEDVVMVPGDPVRYTDRATAQNLATALRQLSPSHPGLFYYSGHAGGGADMESGLALDGGFLNADLIFTTGPDGPVLPFPQRALLAACASSGAGGAGAGEWFGLSAAVLWAGARQVVATNWRVWDSPFTSRFDRDLAQALRHSGDAAAALRSVQLNCLRSWRSVSGSLATTEQPLPVIWAAYSCLGTRS